MPLISHIENMIFDSYIFPRNVIRLENFRLLIVELILIKKYSYGGEIKYSFKLN